MDDDFLDFCPFPEGVEPFPGKTYMADGWRYKDFRLMPASKWDEMLAKIGEDNYQLLTMMQRTVDGKTFKRGQMIISPDGVKILANSLN